jgi:virginiamycin B lyase
MLRTIGRYLLPMFAAVLVCGVPSAFSQYAPGGPVLKGTVKSSDGKPMEGVTVSTRGEGKSFATTVYTDPQGAYYFPPLEKGKFKLWAQAEGFEGVRLDVNIANQTQQVPTIELKPLKDVKEITKQLSGAEFLASIQDSYPSDLRMEEVFTANCTGCHQSNYLLQNRLDASGWRAIINVMTKIRTEGYVPEKPNVDQVMDAYKDEIATFLGKVRGPDSTFVPKIYPRPTGDSTRIVVTEFDLPRPEDSPSVLRFDGSDWSQGTPSRYAGRASHDVALDHDGNVWFADDLVPGRTFGKLDPRTGTVTNYAFPFKGGEAVDTHTVFASPDGMTMWTETGNSPGEGVFLSFDIETGKFKRYPSPPGTGRIGNSVTVDSKGNAWGVTQNGVLKLIPSTGEYTFYKAIHPGSTYGVSIDADDKAWVAFTGNDVYEVVDQQGNISEVALPALKTNLANDKDMDLMTHFRLGPNSMTPAQKGPRRMGGDLNQGGHFLWSGEFQADQIARIDIHTKEVKEYPVPKRWTMPYKISVDKNHMVWINLDGIDGFLKFNPDTEKFTEYPLPTRGSETRYIQVDNTTDPVTVWIPYDRVNKIARIQLR